MTDPNYKPAPTPVEDAQSDDVYTDTSDTYSYKSESTPEVEAVIRLV